MGNPPRRKEVFKTKGTRWGGSLFSSRFLYQSSNRNFSGIYFGIAPLCDQCNVMCHSPNWKLLTAALCESHIRMPRIVCFSCPVSAVFAYLVEVHFLSRHRFRFLSVSSSLEISIRFFSFFSIPILVLDTTHLLFFKIVQIWRGGGLPTSDSASFWSCWVAFFCVTGCQINFLNSLCKVEL